MVYSTWWWRRFLCVINGDIDPHSRFSSLLSKCVSDCGTKAMKYSTLVPHTSSSSYTIKSEIISDILAFISKSQCYAVLLENQLWLKCWTTRSDKISQKGGSTTLMFQVVQAVRKSLLVVFPMSFRCTKYVFILALPYSTSGSSLAMGFWPTGSLLTCLQASRCSSHVSWREQLSGHFSMAATTPNTISAAMKL